MLFVPAQQKMMMICKQSKTLLIANHFLLANVVANVANIPHICDLFDEFASKNWSQIFASIFASKNRTRKAPENTDICDLGGRKYATKIFRSNFSTPGIAIAIASPTGIICIHRRPLHLVVTLVGGILEYGCLGTHISGARCGDRALLGAYLRPRKYICGH